MTAQPNWRELHKRSMKQSQPKTFREMWSSGALSQHLDAVDQVARETYLMMVEQLYRRNPTWTSDQIARCAAETVLRDIVLVRDQTTLEAEAQGGYLD